MKERLLNEITATANKYISDDNTLKEFSNAMESILDKYKVKEDINDYPQSLEEKHQWIEEYIVCRKIGGLSQKTLALYKLVLTHFADNVAKPFNMISAFDIRNYLRGYQEQSPISNRTLDSKRTIICGFFNWLAGEEYITKNPALKIQPIKYERIHKKAMSQMDLEKIRSVLKTPREKAVIELLFSTGCRVSELITLKVSDINFETKEVSILGKGNKHRISYLNARAEVSIKEYLDSRKGDSLYLISTERAPYGKTTKANIEKIIRDIEERAKDQGLSTHITPHVFRHTTATVALNRGMNILDVSKLLGHENLDTTMEYITSDMKAVKTSHQNFIV